MKKYLSRLSILIFTCIALLIMPICDAKDLPPGYSANEWFDIGTGESFLYIPDLKENNAVHQKNPSKVIYSVWELNIEDDGSYTKILMMFNFGNQSYSMPKIIKYDKDGNVLSSNDISNANWRDLPPGSIGMAKYTWAYVHIFLQ